MTLFISFVYLLILSGLHCIIFIFCLLCNSNLYWNSTIEIINLYWFIFYYTFIVSKNTSYCWISIKCKRFDYRKIINFLLLICHLNIRYGYNIYFDVLVYKNWNDYQYKITGTVQHFWFSKKLFENDAKIIIQIMKKSQEIKKPI